MKDRIITGSKAFFTGIKGFSPKDTDFIELVYEKQPDFNWTKQISDGTTCLFKIIVRPKEELINFAVEKCPPMALCRFLTPDFAKAIDLTISDLNMLKPMRDKLDDKHLYLGIIYDSYLENEDFTLTEEQRNAAYECYKQYRKDKYRHEDKRHKLEDPKEVENK